MRVLPTNVWLLIKWHTCDVAELFVVINPHIGAHPYISILQNIFESLCLSFPPLNTQWIHNHYVALTLINSWASPWPLTTLNGLMSVCKAKLMHFSVRACPCPQVYAWRSNKRGHWRLTVILPAMASLLHVSVHRQSPHFFAIIGEQLAALNALNKADTYVVTDHDLLKYLRLFSKLAQS